LPDHRSDGWAFNVIVGPNRFGVLNLDDAARERPRHGVGGFGHLGRLAGKRSQITESTKQDGDSNTRGTEADANQARTRGPEEGTTAEVGVRRRQHGRGSRWSASDFGIVTEVYPRCKQHRLNG
jgi:hypothetical protein